MPHSPREVPAGTQPSTALQQHPSHPNSSPTCHSRGGTAGPACRGSSCCPAMTPTASLPAASSVRRRPWCKAATAVWYICQVRGVRDGVRGAPVPQQSCWGCPNSLQSAPKDHLCLSTLHPRIPLAPSCSTQGSPHPLHMLSQPLPYPPYITGQLLPCLPGPHLSQPTYTQGSLIPIPSAPCPTTSKGVSQEWGAKSGQTPLLPNSASPQAMSPSAPLMCTSSVLTTRWVGAPAGGHLGAS